MSLLEESYSDFKGSEATDEQLKNRIEVLTLRNNDQRVKILSLNDGVKKA